MSEATMKKCFIIMPISTPEHSLEFYNSDADHFLHVLDCLFIPAIESSGLAPIGPIVAGSDLIHAKIIQNLSSADLVLCDMSQLNPNVFFEFGIRTALNKPVCLVTDEVSINIPFDTGIINYHRYNSTLQGWLIKDEVKKLVDHINQTLESEPDRNSLWKYFGIAQTATFGTEQATPDDKLSLLIRKLESMTDSLPSSTYTPDLVHLPDVLPPYRQAREAFEKAYFGKLFSSGQSLSTIAQQTGMSRAALYNVMKRVQESDEEA